MFGLIAMKTWIDLRWSEIEIFVEYLYCARPKAHSAQICPFRVILNFIKCIFGHFNPNQCGLFGQNDPLRDSVLWTLQFWSNKHCFIWELASSAKIWDLIEVAEAHSLASGGIGSDRGQTKKKSEAKILTETQYTSKEASWKSLFRFETK